LNVSSLEDFVRLVRSQPGKLNWAATPGLPDYIFAALQRSAGIKMTQVSYRDFTPALQDLGEGRIHVAVSGLSFLLPQVQTGKAKLLMVTNHERAPLAPDIPTAQEAGYPDLTFDGVVGFYGWRDMPADLKQRIAADVRAVGADPAIGARIASAGSLVRLGGPAEFAAAIEEQRAKIAAIHDTVVRACHQSADRKAPRPLGAPDAARPRRRGDRIRAALLRLLTAGSGTNAKCFHVRFIASLGA
jgi:tripartite-type tricarboxylate transporter receptor subunit TctC